MNDNVNKAVATRALGSLFLNMLRKVIAKLGLEVPSGQLDNPWLS